MTKLLPIAALALMIAAPALPQASARIAAGTAQPSPLAPGEIVQAAPKADWVAIAPADLLVMDLASDAKGKPRRVVIQLMPPPFSQGWIGNIRKLAAAKWWDGMSVNRVQDNYVVQWGDGEAEDKAKAKALPAGLVVVPESEYAVDGDTLSEASINSKAFDFIPAERTEVEALPVKVTDPDGIEAAKTAAISAMLAASELGRPDEPTAQEAIELISIDSTRTERMSQGWHERDGYAEWVELWKGWPIANYEKGVWLDENDKPVATPANTQRHELAKQRIYKEVEESWFWPVHCYGMVGVGRDMPPSSGSGAELYTVIGHAPRHLDRNIALVGRVIEGIEHLSSLPRGTLALGFYATPEERTTIRSIRIGTEIKDLPSYEYLSTESASFARYVDARANRRDPFFIRPAGGVDICNIPVPVRRAQ